VSRHAIDGVPHELLAHGPDVLVVDRFDRTASGDRIHMEDAAQIVGATGDRKYTMATSETVVNMVRRFSTDNRADILEAVRRLVADVLVGNGDNHLKNWSFLFPRPGEVRLSPAYDIVPTILFMPRDQLALRFVGTHDFARVNLHRFERVASFLRVDPRWIAREVRACVERALELWPPVVSDLLGKKRAATIMQRLPGLQLVKEALDMR
jgi:serine/threonine-protein kinase HipA